jgi:putative oxidoreductase
LKLHARVFGVIERSADTWLLGLIARFAFAAVLWVISSIRQNQGGRGHNSVSSPSQPGAYYQIALPGGRSRRRRCRRGVILSLGPARVLGTYAEFLLPLLMVIGLFSRMAALGNDRLHCGADIRRHHRAPDRR